VTKEIRENMSKIVAESAENAKKRFRELRQKVLESLKDQVKDTDVKKQSERELSSRLEKYVATIDKMTVDKQKELLKQ
jgi:ribosome recycling factor